MPEFVCEPLADRHALDAFACGEPQLDDWFLKSARDSDGRRITRIYVWHAGDDQVVAYYALTPYFIERDTLAKAKAGKLPEQIPCYLLAKLALDGTLRGEGLGAQLLASALENAARAALTAGGRFVVVDALTPAPASFYEHHGFVQVPGVPDRLVLPIKDILRSSGTSNLPGSAGPASVAVQPPLAWLPPIRGVRPAGGWSPP